MEIGEIALSKTNDNTYAARRKAGTKNYSGCTGKKANGTSGKANWNVLMINTATITFGTGLETAPHTEELLTCNDILDCLAFSDRNKDSITITFTKDFLRNIIKSHIHAIRER